MQDSGTTALQGWRFITHCTLPGLSPCHLAAIGLHRQHGIALLDGTAAVTPDAAARLVARLQRAGFTAVYGEAWPPIRHLLLTEAEFANLVPTLENEFRLQPAPATPGSDAWLDTVERALLREPPRAEAPQPSPTTPLPAPAVAAQAPRWRRPALALSLLPVLGALWAFPWSQAPDTPPLAPEEPAPVLAELHLTTGPEPAAPVEIVSAPAPAEPVVAPAVVATVAVPEPLPAVLPVLPAMRRPAPRPQAVTLTASHLPVSKTHFTRAELRCQHVVQQARTGRSVTEDKGRMRCRAGR